MEKRKILIVEDDSFLRELYSELLQVEGYNVSTAVDGNTGFEKMKHGGWDLIILDIMLPIMDGFEILEKLKDTPPSKPNGPVVFLTNFSSDELKDRGYELGGKAYWVKSDLTPGQVAQHVKGIIAQYRPYKK